MPQPQLCAIFKPVCRTLSIIQFLTLKQENTLLMQPLTLAVGVLTLKQYNMMSENTCLASTRKIPLCKACHDITELYNR